jgi:putative hydrolase of the HAD superfamily
VRYQVVAFDLFGTLIRSWHPEQDRQTLAAMASVLVVPVDDLAEGWRVTGDDRMTGAIDGYESCLARICSGLGAEVTEEKIRTAAAIRMEQTRQEMDPHENAEEVLADLRKAGFRTAVISNISKNGIPFWNASPLSRLVDAIAMSCLLGIQKPDPRMYMTVCKLLGVQPNACLYVADGWNNELKGAAATGMTPALIQHPGSPVSSEGMHWKGSTIRSLREVPMLLRSE